MELETIKQIVSDLDIGVSKENAKVKFNQYGGDQEGCVVATQNGFLRLGVEFLKAGVAPYEAASGDRKNSVDASIAYLLTEDSDFGFDYFERREDLVPVTSEDTWQDRIFVSVVIGILVLIPILAIVGLVAIIRALL